MSELVLLGTGRMSVFGGPGDEGVGPHEGLALVAPGDLESWWWHCLFLSEQPPGTTGLARRLDPRSFYLAMRWNYAETPRELLRQTVVRLTNPRLGRFVLARPVDFGPGDGSVIDGCVTKDTHRIADLSPGAAEALGLVTDEEVTCAILTNS